MSSNPTAVALRKPKKIICIALRLWYAVMNNQGVNIYFLSSKRGYSFKAYLSADHSCSELGMLPPFKDDNLFSLSTKEFTII
jgi:hypothetical protein